MRNLPIECLRSFATVAEVKGFTQAGQLLGKSQPAVSLQIKRLEELIGAQVFVRGSHRLELTQPGERMLDYARQILALNDEALAELALPAISGRVRFGIPSEYATILLPRMLGRFSHSYPAVTLEIHCDLSANLLAEEPNPYHLVLALSDSPERAGASWIGADELVWVTSARHDTHRQPTLPLIVAPTPCLYRARAIKVLKDVGRSWRISYTNTDISGIQAAIETFWAEDKKISIYVFGDDFAGSMNIDQVVESISRRNRVGADGERRPHDPPEGTRTDGAPGDPTRPRARPEPS